MTNSPDIDLARIVPHGGSQDRAFEELACQLALSDVPDPSRFRRIRGDGGDGGVECLWTSPTGELHGWQAKYIFDLGRALKKARNSLTTARKNHPALTRYVVCLPMDLSGSKGRDGKSQQDRFDEFKRAAESAQPGLTVELWSAFRLRDRLLATDASGGRRRFWFDAAQLGADRFSAQLDTAIVRAGPRYNPKIHHGHALDETLAALGDTADWRARCAHWTARVREAATSWARAVTRGAADTWSGPFPASALPSGLALRGALLAVSDALGTNDLASAAPQVAAAQAAVIECSPALVLDVDARFGKGAAGSQSFRQRRADIHADFPAAHLDESREVLRMLLDLQRWLAEPAVRAARERVLVLTGPAGIGKTHGLCDVAEKRRAAGLATILVAGGQFPPNQTIWASLSAALGLDGTWSRDVLLDALDVAGASVGRVLLLVDALDERPDRHLWRDDLPELVAAVQQRPNVAVCVSVREGYERQVLREDLGLPTFAHPGFAGAIFDACSAFFHHYGLQPPVGPLLEPELENPLFLRLLCEGLRARRLTSIPPGWTGTRRVLQSLLTARDEEIARARPAAGTTAVSLAMQALAAALPEGGALGLREADRVVDESLPRSQQGGFDLLERMIGWGLLRRLPGQGDAWPSEDQVDIAFGRLRHHLLADRLTGSTARTPADRLRALALDDPGLAEALALVMPERGQGELVDLATESRERAELLAAWLAALPWRGPGSLGDGVEALLSEALADADLDHEAWDAVLSLALRPGHRFDHRSLHAYLSGMPMPQRDAVLCGYLLSAYERAGSPLQRALRASDAGDLSRVTPELRLAWCVVLVWCGAAADLRIRDDATRAAVRVTESDPSVWSTLVSMFAEVDDDAVVERVLCAAYGAVLRNPEEEALRELARVVHARVLHRPGGPRAHALLRGHARCIGQWAATRGALPAGMHREDFEPPHGAPAALRIPSSEEVKRFDSRDYPRIYDSVMSEWTGDFAKYTMPWVLAEDQGLLDAQDARRWVLGEVIALGYTPELHAPYDYDLLGEHGPGRGRSSWAERIGKKYQRIALARLAGHLDDRACIAGRDAPAFAGLNLRDIDPSVLDSSPDEDAHPERAPWWAPARLDFDATKGMGEADWVGGDDFPDPAKLVGPVEAPGVPGERWLLLDGFYQWKDRKDDQDRRYRDAWMMIKGYLVPRSRVALVRKALANADFMGKWMPEGQYWEGSLFLGEYPWSPNFPELLALPDPLDPRAERLVKLGVRPAANHVASIDSHGNDGGLKLTVPSAQLVDASGTRWDGKVGFRTGAGKLVFQDPGALGGGPRVLLGEAGALAAVCEHLGVSLLWTVLAERRIMGDHGDENFAGMKHRSWIVWESGQGVRVVAGRGEHLRPDRTREVV